MKVTPNPESPVTDMTARNTIASLLGDKTGKVYIVDHIPLYEYTGYAESVFGESDKA